MNTPLPIFSVITSILSIVMITVSITVMGITLPKIIQQSRVNDVLIELRRYLLRLFLSVFIILAITLAVLTSRFYIPQDWRVYAVGAMVDLFSVLTVIFAHSFFKIYNLNYTEISMLYQVKDGFDKVNKEPIKVKTGKRVKK